MFTLYVDNKKVFDNTTLSQAFKVGRYFNKKGHLIDIVSNLTGEVVMTMGDTDDDYIADSLRYTP